MVFDAADLQRLHLVRPRDAAQEFPNAIFDLRLNPGPAAFCTEHKMVMQRGVGIRHVIHPCLERGYPCVDDLPPNVNRRYATAHSCAITLPGLKRPGYHHTPLRG